MGRHGAAANAAANNRANQMNPNHSSYQARKTSSATLTTAAANNRANQLNPNHPSYKAARGTCDVPRTFLSPDGYAKLGQWVSNQRPTQRTGVLSADRVARGHL